MEKKSDAQLTNELCFKIGQSLLERCERHEVPREALDRLIKPEGSDMLDTVSLLVEAEYQLSSAPQVGKHSLRVAPPVESSRDIVLVPDMDAAALTAFAKEHCKLTFLDEHYEKWNYLVGRGKKAISGRGKSFAVLGWRPGRGVFAHEVREHFQKMGFYGHTAAFIAWIAQHSPEGYHASIPDNDACLHHFDGDLWAPCSDLNRHFRKLYRDSVGLGLGGSHACFVAFREL